MAPKKKVKVKQTLPASSNLTALVNSSSSSRSRSDSQERDHSKARKEQSRSPSPEQTSSNSRREPEESQRVPVQPRQGEVTSLAHHSSHQPFGYTSGVPPPVHPHLMQPAPSTIQPHLYPDPRRLAPLTQYHPSAFPGAQYSTQPYSTSQYPYQSTQRAGAPMPPYQSGSYSAYQSGPHSAYASHPIPSGQRPTYHPFVPPAPTQRSAQPAQPRRQEDPHARSRPPREILPAGDPQHGPAPSARPPRRGGIFPPPLGPPQQGGHPQQRGHPQQEVAPVQGQHSERTHVFSGYIPPDSAQTVRRHDTKVGAKDFMEDWDKLSPEERMKKAESDRAKRLKDDQEEVELKEKHAKEKLKERDAKRNYTEERRRREAKKDKDKSGKKN